MHVLSILGLILLSSSSAYSQWSLFAELLTRLDKPTHAIVNGNMDSTIGNFTFDHSQGNDAWQTLDGEIQQGNPVGNFDDTWLDDLGAGLDLLGFKLPNLGLDPPDQDTILGEAGHLLDLFQNNQDSLGNSFGLYQDELTFDSSNWSLVVIGFDDINQENLGVLQDTFDLINSQIDPQGPVNFTSLIQQVFNSTTFPDLELAFGIQQASLKYWELPYDAQARTVRVGSVPRFQKNVIQCKDGITRLPIEARWHAQVSWISEHTSNSDFTRKAVEAEGAFNPLLLDGEFAMMAIPVVGRWGNTTFRVISSVGLEAGTYAPAHRNFEPPFTLPNKGFATGFGPQVGAGFAMVNPSLTIYTYGTTAHGDALRARLPYKYNSSFLNAGIRYADIINVRYRTGKVTWQDMDNRRAKIHHEFLIGLILDDLHH